MHWPFSPIGLVKNEKGNGTGTLIGSNIVLTCAHNVYDNKKNINYKNLIFYPAINGPFNHGETRVKSVYFPNDYKSNKDSVEDYALLILENHIGDQFGHMGIHCSNPKNLKGKKYKLYGYPHDKVEDLIGSYEMWGMEGYVKYNEKTTLLEYKIDTYFGQSGSGIFYEDEDGCFIVGVHVLGDQIYNNGVFINVERFSQILEWIVKATGSEPMTYKSYLNFRFRELGIKGLKYLIDNNDFSKVIKLNLGDNELNDEAMKLFSKGNFVNLNSLDLGGNKLGSDGLKNLKKTKFTNNLQKLNLEKNAIGDYGVSELSEIKFFNLIEIDLSRNNISFLGFYIILNANWSNLEVLKLNENYIGDDGLLLPRKNSYKLKELQIKNNNIINKDLAQRKLKNVQKLVI